MRRLPAVLALLVATTGMSRAASHVLFATAATDGRIDAFCVGADGTLGDRKFGIGTKGRFPRRVRIATMPNGKQVLYAVEVDRVEAFQIGPRGGLKSIGTTETTAKSDPHDVVVSPENGKLYVAFKLQNSIAAYDLTADGAPCDPMCRQDPDHPGQYLFTPCDACTAPVALTGDAASEPEYSSCTKTLGTHARWESLELSNGLLYVSGGRVDTGIDIIQLGAGGFLPSIEDPTQPGTKTTGCPQDVKKTGLPFSARRELGGPRAFVLDGVNLYVRPRLKGPRVLQFVLDPDGTFCPDRALPFRPNRKSGDRGCCPVGLPEADCKGIARCSDPKTVCDQSDVNPSTGLPKTPKRLQTPNSRTQPVLNYEDLLLVTGTNGRKALIGSSFDKGRIDSYALDPVTGALPPKPERITSADFRIQASRMSVHAFKSGALVLYVPSGDNDRILGFRLNPNTGLLNSNQAFTKSTQVSGSFPDDAIVVDTESDCNG